MKKKVLLMGRAGAGKTSMRSIIFANYIARDTRRLGFTIDVEHSHIRFLGNLTLHLWDCGGQETFMESFFAAQRDNIFRNVAVLIYVFDIRSEDTINDIDVYQKCLASLRYCESNAKIFCLVHKMDLIMEDSREAEFKKFAEDIKKYSDPFDPICEATSIWDDTLYNAWSHIVYNLIPNIDQMHTSLKKFAEAIDASEVLLFEKTTFLVISRYERSDQYQDDHRFEKISNIIKQFKHSCNRLATQFTSMEVRNEHFAAYVETFTANTYIMVVMPDPILPAAVTLMNIRSARKHFEKVERFEH